MVHLSCASWNLVEELGMSSSNIDALDHGRHWRFGRREGKILQGVPSVDILGLRVMHYIKPLTIFRVSMPDNAPRSWNTASWVFTAHAIIGGLLVLSCLVLSVARSVEAFTIEDWNGRAHPS